MLEFLFLAKFAACNFDVGSVELAQDEFAVAEICNVSSCDLLHHQTH